MLNILPTKTLQSATPHFALFGVAPSYGHLRVFGCLCYPNLSAIAAHKLAPRLASCVFLGYYANHKGHRCLEIQSNRVLISCHVVFDETLFPFSSQPIPPGATDFEFLCDHTNPVPTPIRPVQPLPAGTSPAPAAQPRAASAAPSPAPTQQLEQGLPPVLGAAACYIVIQILYK